LRRALLDLLARVLDEYRFGVRELCIDELRTLVDCWRDVNLGLTPAEMALRFLPGDCDAE